MSPPKLSPKTLLDHESFKGKKGSDLLITEIGDQSLHHPPLCAGSLTPCDLPLDASLVTLFAKFLKRKLGRDMVFY